jgi:hypothetical protein
MQGAFDAGQREIEVGYFVPVRLLTQLANTTELVAFAKALPDLSASVLVPKLKGAERPMECESDLMLLPLLASHAHSLANLRKMPDEVLSEIASIVATQCQRLTHAVEVGISTACGCTLQGAAAPAEVRCACAPGAGCGRGPRWPGRCGRLRRSSDDERPVPADIASGWRQAQLRPFSRMPKCSKACS